MRIRTTDVSVRRDSRIYKECRKCADNYYGYGRQQRGSATAAAVSLIKGYPEINVLVGFNEWMALGVGNAIKQLGVKDTVRGIGFDSNVISVGMIETGEMDALIVQNPFAIGYLGVKNAAVLASGGSISENTIYTAVTPVNK